ncbi:MAG: hypothetical protein ACREQI_01820 [Candidatus Binataceae bacterium]
MTRGAFAPHPPGSFALSADPAFQNEVQEELQALSDRVRNSGRAKSFAGLILTGSFARGEGTLVSHPGTEVRWLSDIECLVVINRGAAPIAEVWRTLRQIEDEFNLDPPRRTRGLRIELRAITSRKLGQLGPAIFTRELFEHGKLLWRGPAAVPMPPWHSDPPPISKHDAFRLLNNRIIEQIAARTEFGDDADGGAAAAYSLVKFWIDLGTSLSVFFGCYEPGYRNRQLPIEAALDREGEALGPGVAARIERRFRNAMAVKLGRAPFVPEETIGEFHEAAEIARSIWHWESAQLLGCAPEPADWRLIFPRMRRIETLNGRIRGWVRLLRKPERLRRLGLRPLIAAARSGSLATLIYGSGCMLDFFWDDIDSGSARGNEIAAMLCPALNVRASAVAHRRRMLARAALGAWREHLRFATA